jgi:hypothetical protein
MSEQVENETAKQVVLPEGPLKEMFVNYVGNKLQPENGEVTVEMVVNVLAEEFPEFLMLVAEENFLRGYQQALVDLENFNNNEKQNTETQKQEQNQQA